MVAEAEAVKLILEVTVLAVKAVVDQVVAEIMVVVILHLLDLAAAVGLSEAVPQASTPSTLGIFYPDANS